MMILLAILAFGLLIFVHELGHLLAAKGSGIRVNEFAIGMGPRLISFVKGETRYSLRALPLGGFCAMGEDDEFEGDDPAAFQNAKLRHRLLTLAAGSAMNLVLGFVLLVVLSANLNLIPTNQVARFAETATSNQLLMEGDYINRVDGSRTRTANDVLYEFSRSRDGVVDIEVIRDGQVLQLTGVRFHMHEIEGASFLVRDFVFYGARPTFFNVLANALNWTYSVARMVWGSLVDLITGRFGFNQVSGPIGVTTAIGGAVQAGLETSTWEAIQNFIYLVSVISVNLGIFNLLPFPALDGGRILFLFIEGVRRKPLPARFESIVNTAGFALLIGLIIFATINDVFRLIT